MIFNIEWAAIDDANAFKDTISVQMCSVSGQNRWCIARKKIPVVVNV
jgi:hypothetical protein